MCADAYAEAFISYLNMIGTPHLTVKASPLRDEGRKEKKGKGLKGREGQDRERIDVNGQKR